MLVVLLGIAPGPAPQPDAYAIFERARQVLDAQTYATPLFYRITVRVSEGDKSESEHFNGETSPSGDVRVAGVSEEEQSAPHEAGGVNFKVSFSIGWNTHAGGPTATMTQDAHRIEASPDYLGVPLISPAYSFGLNATERHDATDGSPDGKPGLPTIATVTARDRAYDVSLLGTEIVNGLYAYHLQLEPRRMPKRYRIRDLWVDAYTYRLVQLRSDGNFTTAPMTGVPWLVTFHTVDGQTYIESESALEPLVLRHDRTFSSASISFDRIRTSGDGPPMLPEMDRDRSVNLQEPESGQ